MNCYLHPELPASAFCRTCGRSLCSLCQRPADGTIFCQDHVPAPAYVPPPGAGAPAPDAAANPYFGQQPAYQAGRSSIGVSPALAFVLGFIPGVGAIYNAQYLKGLVHALVFGLLVTITGNTNGPAEPLIAILLAAFVFYMPFEAYHTAKKREAGLSPDEWSSILPRTQQSGGAPIGPIVLIAIGVLYLLNSLELVNFREIGRFWPVILILVGAYMLYSRVAAGREIPPAKHPPFVDPRTGAGPGEFMGSRHE